MSEDTPPGQQTGCRREKTQQPEGPHGEPERSCGPECFRSTANVVHPCSPMGAVGIVVSLGGLHRAKGGECDVRSVRGCEAKESAFG